jgi:hypothetical protein
VHVADAGNILANQTSLAAIGDVPLVAGAVLVVGALRTPGAPIAMAQNLGVYLPLGTSNPLQAIFHENGAVDVPAGRRYAVTVPGFGLDGYTHLTGAANVTAQYTTLARPGLDSTPAAIAVATHNYLDAGPYHDFAIGLEYIGTRWNLRNEDFAVDMGVGRRFNIVVAPVLSGNAFRVQTAAAGSATELVLVHPLLDDNPCASPLVGRVDVPGAPSVFNPTPFSTEYRAGTGGAPGRWLVVAESAGAPIAATFATGAAFNVIIDGAQANGCRAPRDDAVFGNGFE